MCNFSQGIERKGIEKGIIKIAQKMIKRGDSIEEIVDISELPIDMVEKLKADLMCKRQATV